MQEPYEMYIYCLKFTGILKSLSIKKTSLKDQESMYPLKMAFRSGCFNFLIALASI